MKKTVSILVMIAMLLGMFAMTASAEGDYTQAPMFDALVEAGELPPVEERLPDVPAVNTYDYAEENLEMEIGTYGGTARFSFSSVNWNPDVFIAMDENILSMQGINSNVITPNMVEEYTMSDDYTTFTFKLRKGLKWSDGTEVVMEDFAFTVEHVIFNEELTPVISTWMTRGGEPFTFTVIDDLTFEIKFKEAYGSFPMYLTANGWKGYPNLLKPAYYLKPYHKDFAEEIHGSLEAYYEFMQPFATVMGYDDITADEVWTYVYNQIDCTEWEITDPNDALITEYFPGLIDKNMPQLYPWIMISNNNGVQVWERNPYYHKVDADGQQLPYIDYLQNTYVEDPEMAQLDAAAGEIDLMRESATMDNISLYRENAEAANINAVMCTQGVTDFDIGLNMTYGLNTDGTLKEDEYSQTWQEVVNIKEFRQALAMSIDAMEMSDALCGGTGVFNENSLCTGDVEGAKDLLDSIGMVDIDGDGWRETPSGKPFSFMLWVTPSATNLVPATELFVEFIREIGINVSGNQIESSLMSTNYNANEVPARVAWGDSSIIWYYNNEFSMSQWARLWHLWFANGRPMDSTEYLAPTREEDLKLLDDIYNMLSYSIDEVVNEIRPSILKYLDEECYWIRPLAQAQGCVVLNADLRNIPTGVITHSVNYFFENMYFEQ